MKSRVVMGVMVAVFIVSGIVLAQSGQSADVQFKAAQYKEEVEGDIQGAIADYKALANSSDRAIAAASLLRLGALYEKVGNQQARAVYEQIVRGFAEHLDVVNEARSRIAALSAPRRDVARGNADQLALSGSAERNLDYSNVSPDGRYLAFDSWANPPLELWLHDFETSASRQLTNSGREPGPEKAEFSLFKRAFSLDGRQLAYSWYATSRPGPPGPGMAIQLRIAGLEGSGLLKPRVLVDTDEVNWIEPHAWDPTGRWIAVTLQRPDETGHIALVSTTSGSLSVLRSMAWRGQVEMSLSPDGRFLAFERRDDNSFARDIAVLELDLKGAIPAVVREITLVEHAGDDGLVGWSPDGSQLLFASDRMGSRGLWAQPFADGKLLGSARLIKPGIPEFEVAGLTRSGALYYRIRPRSLSDIKVARVDFTGGEVLSQPEDIQEFAGTNSNPAWSHDGRSLAYISERRQYPATGRVLVIRSLETREVREFTPVEINTPALGQLRWSHDDRALTIEAVSHFGDGGLFRIDAGTGETTALATNRTEVQFHPMYTLSPDGRKVFFRRLAPGQIDLIGSAPRLFDLIERDLASGLETTLVRASGALGGPSAGYRLSADGESLYYRRPVSGHTAVGTPAQNGGGPLRYELVARDLATGRDRVLSVGPGLGLGSPNGRYQLRAIVDANTRIQLLVDLSTGGSERELMRYPLSEQTGLVMWAPDSNSILFRRDQDLWWIPFDGRSPRKLDIQIDFSRPLSEIVVHPDGQRVAFRQRDVIRDFNSAEVRVLKDFLPPPTTSPGR